MDRFADFLRESGLSGDPESAWIVVDLFDVFVHLFLPEAREYYDLETLWRKKA